MLRHHLVLFQASHRKLFPLSRRARYLRLPMLYALFWGSVSRGNGSHSQWPSKKKRKRSLEDATMCAIWRRRRRRRKLPPSDLVFPSKVRKRRGGNPTADNPFHRQTGWERKRKRDRRILSASVSGKRGGGMTYRVSFPQFPTNVWANRRSKSLISKNTSKNSCFRRRNHLMLLIQRINF